MSISPQFILFEGIDGSGKTTQAKILANKLNEYTPAIFIREPTDAQSGIRIRELIQSGNSPDAEYLTKLFIEDRAYDVSTNILPALKAGTSVVLDRYYYSNAAYQSNNDIEIAHILRENRSRNFPEPDIIFYIDISPEEALQRVGNRDSLQCFERREELERIRANYVKIAEKFIIIDGSRSIDAVHANIMDYLDTLTGSGR